MQPEFIMFIGIPASGKTFGRTQFPDAEIISSDDIRWELFQNYWDPSNEEQLWGIVKTRVEKCLKRKKHCLLDATNLIGEYRQEFIQIANQYQARKIAVIFNTSYEICMTRDKVRERQVGIEVMERMKEQWDYFFKNDLDCLKNDFNQIIIKNPPKLE